MNFVPCNGFHSSFLRFRFYDTFFQPDCRMASVRSDPLIIGKNIPGNRQMPVFYVADHLFCFCFRHPFVIKDLTIGIHDHSSAVGYNRTPEIIFCQNRIDPGRTSGRYDHKWNLPFFQGSDGLLCQRCKLMSGIQKSSVHITENNFLHNFSPLFAF